VARLTFLAIVVSLSLASSAVFAEATGEASAREAAERFGRGLVAGDLAPIKALLPEKGRVQLALDRLGPEQGSFSPNQVEALLRAFLSRGSVRSVSTPRVEHDPQGVAIASSRVDATDQDGRPFSIELHLTFQTEGSRWVLREIRESPR